MQERLQKIIATAGIASRRAAEELITAGEVTVNGKVVTELGTKADAEVDHIKVRGKLINPTLKKLAKVHVLLNKPKGYLSSVSDPEGRPTVMDLLPTSLGRVYPVGRLDFNTEGLLLLTNDGDFTNFITSARNKVEKVYEAKVRGIPEEKSIERLRKGVTLEDGVRTAPAKIRRLGETENNAWFEILLHEGKNQQIRKMFDLIGNSVIKLRRSRIGVLRDDDLKPGRWRRLSEHEVQALTRRPATRTKAPKKSRAAGHGPARA
ncbi:MAG TPA: pseudouridine synthase [Pyrinomonadaceae bacterium]|nr:pseudouridine synthase [Pyrinomonadaceae bacterium]